MEVTNNEARLAQANRQWAARKTGEQWAEELSEDEARRRAERELGLLVTTLKNLIGLDVALALPIIYEAHALTVPAMLELLNGRTESQD